MKEQIINYPIYASWSGSCQVCHADTLWGDAPHNEGCEAAMLMEKLQLFESTSTVETKLSTIRNRSFQQ